MLQIKEFTEAPRQTCSLPLETRESVSIKLYFAPTQKSWYFDLRYGDFITNGNKLVLSPNILRGFKNQLPFGMTVVAENGIEPFLLTDFTTGRVKIYILSADEVEEFEKIFYNEMV